VAQTLLTYSYENDTGWDGETLQQAERTIADGLTFTINVPYPIIEEQAKDLARRWGAMVNYSEAITPGTKQKRN
jgi:hypothetical protein